MFGFFKQSLLKVLLWLITKHNFSSKSFKNAPFRIKHYFAKIPIFSRKMISHAYISANPSCQISTDHGSGFQGTQIRGSRLQSRELRTFPICHLLKIYTLSSGSVRRAQPRSWLWDKSGMKAPGGNNGIFAGLCSELVEQQNFWVPGPLCLLPGHVATGTDGHRRQQLWGRGG